MLIGANRLFSQIKSASSPSSEKETDGVGFDEVLKASEGRISAKSIKGSTKGSVGIDPDTALEGEPSSGEESLLADILAFVESKQPSSFRLAIPDFMKDDFVQDPVGPLTQLDADGGATEVDEGLCCPPVGASEGEGASGGGVAVGNRSTWGVDWKNGKVVPVGSYDLTEEFRFEEASSSDIAKKLEFPDAEFLDMDFVDNPITGSPVDEELGLVAKVDEDPSGVGKAVDVPLVDEVKGTKDEVEILSSAVLPDLQSASNREQPSIEAASDQIEPAKVDKKPYFALSFSPNPRKKEEAGSESILGVPADSGEPDLSAPTEIKAVDTVALSKSAKEEVFSSNAVPSHREASDQLEVKRDDQSSFDDIFSSSNSEKEGLQGKSSLLSHGLVGNSNADYRSFISSTPGLPAPEFLPQRGVGSLSNGLVNVVKFLQSNGELKAQVIVDPPSLGRVEVQIHAVPGGALEASFSVDNASIRDMIKAQVPLLQDLLAQQGISISQMSVDVRTGDGQRQRWDGTKGSKRGRFAAEGVDSLEEAVPLARIDLEQGILMWIA